VQVAMKGFEDVIKKFPKCAEGYALYAQVHFTLPFIKIAAFFVPFVLNNIRFLK